MSGVKLSKRPIRPTICGECKHLSDGICDKRNELRSWDDGACDKGVFDPVQAMALGTYPAKES